MSFCEGSGGEHSVGIKARDRVGSCVNGACDLEWTESTALETTFSELMRLRLRTWATDGSQVEGCDQDLVAELGGQRYVKSHQD